MKKIDYASYFFDRSVIILFIKVFVILIPFFLTYFIISNYIKRAENRGNYSEKVVIGYLRSLVDNPESFYRASFEYEKKNRYSKAIIEMQFAISLLEGQPVHSAKLDCYRRRLAFLEQEKLFYEGF